MIIVLSIDADNKDKGCSSLPSAGEKQAQNSEEGF